MLSALRPYVPGLAFAISTAMVGLAAMNNQNNLLFWVFGMLVASMAISLVMASVVIRRVEVRRLDPRFGAVGEPLIMRYAVSNRSRWLSVFNIHVEELSGGRRDAKTTWRRLMKPAAAWVMHAGPRETVHGEATFWPIARGEAAFDRLRVWTTFPFGIVRRSRVISQPQHTLVYPRLFELRRGLLGSIAPMGLMGSKLAHHAGAGDDYFGLREYRPGDSMRHISWKRTARHDQLVTIERTAPAPAKLRVVLDLTVPTSALPGSGGDRNKAREMEERAIALAASIIHAADLDGFEVGLTLVGMGGAPPIAVRRNQWHFHKIMAALAGIDLDRERSAHRPLPVRDAERAAIVVIAPDRVQPLAGREDALHLTAATLDSLAVRAIGWQESGEGGGARHVPASSSATASRAAREVAAA
jgi:uncharacterized protein (DUF58 family)